MQALFGNWLLSFVLTLTVEVSLVLFVLRHRPEYIVVVAALVNIFTQPFATLAYYQWSDAFWLIEGSVILVEAGLFWALLVLRWWRAGAVALLVNGVTISMALGWIYYFTPIQLTYSVVQPCFTETPSQIITVSCIETELSRYAELHPDQTKALSRGLWLLLQYNVIEVDARWFSPLAHNLGMLLYESYDEPMLALEQCGHDWLNACIHGVVMAYNPTDSLAWCKLVDTADYADCVHGAGHILARASHSSLLETLEPCATLITTQLQSACASGIFMEHSVGGLDGDTHAATPGQFMSLPCAELLAEWQPVCYASAGSYRQYLPGFESFTESYNWCDQNAGAYIQDCRSGVTQRVSLSGLGEKW